MTTESEEHLRDVGIIAVAILLATGLIIVPLTFLSIWTLGQYAWDKLRGR